MDKLSSDWKSQSGSWLRNHLKLEEIGFSMLEHLYWLKNYYPQGMPKDASPSLGLGWDLRGPRGTGVFERWRWKISIPTIVVGG